MEELFTVEQTAQYLKCDVGTVYVYIHNKKLRAAKIGRSWKIRQSDIAQFLEDCISLQIGDVKKTSIDGDSLTEETNQRILVPLTNQTMNEVFIIVTSKENTVYGRFR